MLVVRERLNGSASTWDSPAAEQLVLPFELRQKSRLRARLKSGLEVGLFLERGIFLRGGDLLLAEDGTVVEVVAAPETVSTVQEPDPTKLARAAYHLGNRHVPVQIGTGWLRYGHDHVLDDMVRGLGLIVVVEQAPFEPEGGAYGGHSHPQSDGHSHSHSHGDGHSHSHGHSHGGAHSHVVAGAHAHEHSPAASGELAHNRSHEPGHAPGRGFGVLLDKHDDHHH